MPVITISRQTGSGGMTIGQRLADGLGINYLNTQIIQEVAHRLGVSEATAAQYSERAEAFIERLSRILWAAQVLVPMSGNDIDPNAIPPFASNTELSVAIARQLIQEAAQAGNVVIFGHGAQFILADQPQVLHVRLIAPFPVRVERVMRRDQRKRAEAERWVREEDQRRANHIRQFFQADWEDPTPFHLILNTGLWDEKSCIRLIRAAVAEHEQTK